MSSNFNLSNETAPALEDQDDDFPLMDALPPPLPGQESSYSTSYARVGSFERSQLGGEETDMPNLDDNSVEVEEILAGRRTFQLLDDNANNNTEWTTNIINGHDDATEHLEFGMAPSGMIQPIDASNSNQQDKKPQANKKQGRTGSGKGTNQKASSTAKKRQFDQFKNHFDNMLSNQLNEHLPPEWPSVDSDFFEYATKKVKHDLDMDENTKKRLSYVLDVSMGTVKAVEESNENEVKPSNDDLERIALLESEIETRKAEIQRIKSSTSMMTNISSSSGMKHAQVWWNTVKALQKVPRGIDYAKKDCRVCRVAVGRIIDLSDHDCPYCRCCFDESWKQLCVLREDCVKHHGQAESLR